MHIRLATPRLSYVIFFALIASAALALSPWSSAQGDGDRIPKRDHEYLDLQAYGYLSSVSYSGAHLLFKETLDVEPFGVAKARHLLANELCRPLDNRELDVPEDAGLFFDCSEDIAEAESRAVGSVGSFMSMQDCVGSSGINFSTSVWGSISDCISLQSQQVFSRLYINDPVFGGWTLIGSTDDDCLSCYTVGATSTNTFASGLWYRVEGTHWAAGFSPNPATSWTQGQAP